MEAEVCVSPGLVEPWEVAGGEMELVMLLILARAEVADTIT